MNPKDHPMFEPLLNQVLPIVQGMFALINSVLRWFLLFGAHYGYQSYAFIYDLTFIDTVYYHALIIVGALWAIQPLGTLLIIFRKQKVKATEKFDIQDPNKKKK